MERYYNLEGRTDAESLEKMKRSIEEDVVREMLDRKELNASELIEKLGLVQMTQEQYQKFMEQFIGETDEYWRNYLESLIWTEVSIEGEDEDGNFRSGYQIQNGNWRVNSLAHYMSEEPWTKTMRIGNTTYSVQRGDIYASSWYENDLEEEVA